MFVQKGKPREGVEWGGGVNYNNNDKRAFPGPR